MKKSGNGTVATFLDDIVQHGELTLINTDDRLLVISYESIVEHVHPSEVCHQ